MLERKKRETFEMRCYEKVLKIKQTEKVRNEKVLEKIKLKWKFGNNDRDGKTIILEVMVEIKK